MRITKESPLRRLLSKASMLTALTFAFACSETHATPQEGTEMGIPPVLDSSLIALMVGADYVHMAGSEGAVTPGGSAVEITSVGTGKVFRGVSNADGSFDIVVGTGEYDSFEVRAVGGDKTSTAVTVDRGRARVEPTMNESSHAQSCTELRAKAIDQVSIAASQADKSCTRDDDCLWQETATQCSDDCGRWIVSKAGSQSINQAVDVANEQLCGTFMSKGCIVTRPPCAPTIEQLACISGQCQLQTNSSTPSMPSTPSADCTSSFDAGRVNGFEVAYWYSSEVGVCLPRRYDGTARNGNHYATRAECETSCVKAPPGACPPNRKRAEVCVLGADLVGCAERANVCAKVCSTGADCVGDPIGRVCHNGLCDSFDDWL